MSETIVVAAPVAQPDAPNESDLSEIKSSLQQVLLIVPELRAQISELSNKLTQMQEAGLTLTREMRDELKAKLEEILELAEVVEEEQEEAEEEAEPDESQVVIPQVSVTPVEPEPEPEPEQTKRGFLSTVIYG